MKFPIRRFVVSVILGCILSTLTISVSAQTPGADDWSGCGKVEKETKGAAPQAAIDARSKFYENHPNLMPHIGINVTVKIGYLYADKLKNQDKPSKA